MTDGPKRPGRRVWPEGEPDVEAEIASELEAHFLGTVDLLVERGWTEEEARAEARRRFGDVDRWRHVLESMALRRRWRVRARSALEGLAAVFLSAARSLRRAPGLSAAVVVTLSLGIGANAAVFRVVDRLLLSPPEHIDRPSEVRRLHQTVSGQDGVPDALEGFTYPDVRALRAAGFPARFAAAVYGRQQTLGAGEGAVRVRVSRADSAYLPLLGVDAALGRAFTVDDHRPGAAPVALLAHALWSSRFGSDPDVLGRTLRLGDARVEVVGVLPDGFVGAEPPAVDVWLPLEATAGTVWGDDWADAQNNFSFHVLARLPGGQDEQALQADARAVLARSRADGYGLRGELLSVGTSSLAPGDRPYAPPTVSVSRWLAGVALLVLLVACANVANLFLAQGERIRRETVVRQALGAAHGRIAAELLIRALLLALVGAAGALALATWGGNVLDQLFLADMHLGARPQTGRLLLFLTVAAVGAAMLSGLVPAMRTPRADLRRGLGGEGRGATGGGRLRRTLVGVQAALSALLLVGALLFVLSLRAALRLDLGFDHERLLMVRLEAVADPVQQRDAEDAGAEDGDAEGGAEARAAAALRQATAQALYRAAEEALLGVPGVASVTSTLSVPFRTLYGIAARLPGEDSAPRSPDGRRLDTNGVGDRYFATMGVPVLRGRGIEREDLVEGAAPVVVVSRSAARRLWPGEDALGKCLLVGRDATACARVVGVAAEHFGASFSLADHASGPAMMAWAPLPVTGRTSPSALIVRVEGEVAAATEAVRRRMLDVPGVRYAEVASLASFVDRHTRSWRLGATVFSLFGLLALGVAAVGLYSVLAYDVARRRREIGIRMALGARRGRVMGRVLGAAVTTVAAGLTVALPLAAWGAGRMGSLLFEVSPRDPAVFALAAVLLLLTGALAAATPAWRATRVDPREALAEG